jgi:hypothetical protein
MDFRANYVSTSVAGDYYQPMFEAEQDADDPVRHWVSVISFWGMLIRQSICSEGHARQIRGGGLFLIGSRERSVSKAHWMRREVLWPSRSSSTPI